MCKWRAAFGSGRVRIQIQRGGDAVPPESLNQWGRRGVAVPVRATVFFKPRLAAKMPEPGQFQTAKVWSLLDANQQAGLPFLRSLRLQPAVG
jgi:hypothetical protein